MFHSIPSTSTPSNSEISDKRPVTAKKLPPLIRRLTAFIVVRQKKFSSSLSASNAILLCQDDERNNNGITCIAGSATLVNPPKLTGKRFPR
jgi:hypothetical protein